MARGSEESQREEPRSRKLGLNLLYQKVWNPDSIITQAGSSSICGKVLKSLRSPSQHFLRLDGEMLHPSAATEKAPTSCLTYFFAIGCLIANQSGVRTYVDQLVYLKSLLCQGFSFLPISRVPTAKCLASIHP